MASNGVRWRKSTKSGSQGNCVEVAQLDARTIGVRDSKNPSGAVLTFDVDVFRGFIAAVHDGEFDN